MIKLGIGLIGVLVVAAPVIYEFIKNKEDKNNQSTIPDHQEHIEESELAPNTEDSDTQNPEIMDHKNEETSYELSEEGKKILDWAKNNGGCKIKVYDEKSSSYLEISKLPRDFEFVKLMDGFNKNENYWKGLCKQANPNYGRSGDLNTEDDGLMIKKQRNGDWDVEDEEE